MGISQAVRHRILIPTFVGSNPTCPVKKIARSKYMREHKVVLNGNVVIVGGG